MQVGKIWLDGKMVAQENANVSVLTHSLHYGVAVFEGVRAYQTHDGRTAIFRLDEHTDRLINSAKIFMLQVPFDKQTLMQAQKQAVRENGLTSAYLRPLVWLGDDSLGMSAKNSVHAMVAAWEWGAYLGAKHLVVAFVSKLHRTRIIYPIPLCQKPKLQAIILCRYLPMPKHERAVLVKQFY